MPNLDVQRFEEALNELIDVFQKEENDYFFTEKELHSYFYHLCLGKEFYHQGFNLVHTEYPTPFKCETLTSKPYIRRVADDKRNKIRAHIDLVLINKNYIDYAIKEKGKEAFRYLSGIENALFSKYIKEHKAFYEKFARAYNESILLYAIEFKYLRHSSSGKQQPENEVQQDISKLKLLRDLEVAQNIAYCKNIKSLVFVGDRMIKHVQGIKESLADDEKNICQLIYRKE